MFEHGGDRKLIIRKVFVAKKILKIDGNPFMTVMKKLEQWKIAGENEWKDLKLKTFLTRS